MSSQPPNTQQPSGQGQQYQYQTQPQTQNQQYQGQGSSQQYQQPSQVSSSQWQPNQHNQNQQYQGQQVPLYQAQQTQNTQNTQPYSTNPKQQPQHSQGQSTLKYQSQQPQQQSYSSQVNQPQTQPIQSQGPQVSSQFSQGYQAQQPQQQPQIVNSYPPSQLQSQYNQPQLNQGSKPESQQFLAQTNATNQLNTQPQGNSFLGQQNLQQPLGQPQGQPLGQPSPNKGDNKPNEPESPTKDKKEKDKKDKDKKEEKKDEKKEEKKPLQQPELTEEAIKSLTGPQILAFMKKKPYTQLIGQVQYTYSVMNKKQATFVGSNTRFLYLKGIESLSYARQFKETTPLPFTEQAQIPKSKSTYLLSQIESSTTDQEKLIINFSGEKKVKWEFVCPNKNCALQWKKKIENAKKTFQNFKASGFDKYEDFARAQQLKAQKLQFEQQSNVNNLLQNPNQNNGPLRFQSNDSPIKSNISNNFGSNNNPQTSNFTNPNKPNSFGNNNNPQTSNLSDPNKPTSVQFRGPQASQIDNFIMDSGYRSNPQLNQSMSRIPIEQKQGIKGEIRRLRRNWIEQLIGGQQEVELIIDFKNYVHKIAEVIINELYVSQDVKIYPSFESSKESATYLIDDIFIEIYFFTEDNLSSKHLKYRNAVQEFKNYEYLINTTKNQGILKVPLMTLFEYKGFLGMAKSKIGENNKGFKNREFYDLINRKQFQQITRISTQTLLNESKCKIVSYDRQHHDIRFSTQFNKVYFVQRLAQFLPVENGKQFGPSQDNILRSEFITDIQFQDSVFRDRNKVVRPDKINGLIDKKIDQFIRVLENEDSYFTNSNELAELLHFYGLNIHYLGVIYKRTKLSWLRRIFQAEIAARCLKNYFRLEMQNSILQSFDQTNRRERQEERERGKVISFLNNVFGNTEPTFRLWRNLNSSAIQKYHIKIWDHQFTDMNSGYLLQAIQTHLKIVLNNRAVDRKVFKSVNSFDYNDFIGFKFESDIYNLDFTNIFELIQESFEEETIDSFQNLCQILTKDTSTKIPYLELLKTHSIHDKISQFLLNFTSPQDNYDLYHKIEQKNIPHKFLYESKFAEIKWSLKSNKQDNIIKATNFVQDHVRKWLGQSHPLLVQLYRILAEYFSEMQFYYTKALQYATDSLKMQKVLFEGDSEPMWRDYYLVGKIHYINNRSEESLSFLGKAKALVKPQKLIEYESYGELCIMLAKGYFASKYYKQSYTTVRELYKIIREERDERSLIHIVEAVTLIKQLLQINQEHESYYKFVESDFSSVVHAFADYPNLMNQSIKMIAIPYLKNVILRNSKNKMKLLNIIEEISKIKQSSSSCQAYIKAKISQGTFPKSYLHCLKEIDSVIEEILANQMIERWKSFNNLANQSILDKIGNSQINRGFDFLANMTALFNLLGTEVLEELFIMEK